MCSSQFKFKSRFVSWKCSELLHSGLKWGEGEGGERGSSTRAETHLILDRNHKNQSALVNEIVGDSLEKVRLGYLKLKCKLNSISSEILHSPVTVIRKQKRQTDTKERNIIGKMAEARTARRPPPQQPAPQLEGLHQVSLIFIYL